MSLRQRLTHFVEHNKMKKIRIIPLPVLFVGFIMASLTYFLNSGTLTFKNIPTVLFIIISAFVSYFILFYAYDHFYRRHKTHHSQLLNKKSETYTQNNRFFYRSKIVKLFYILFSFIWFAIVIFLLLQRRSGARHIYIFSLENTFGLLLFFAIAISITLLINKYFLK